VCLEPCDQHFQLVLQLQILFALPYINEQNISNQFFFFFLLFGSRFSGGFFLFCCGHVGSNAGLCDLPLLEIESVAVKTTWLFLNNIFQEALSFERAKSIAVSVDNFGLFAGHGKCRDILCIGLDAKVQDLKPSKRYPKRKSRLVRKRVKKLVDPAKKRRGKKK
jgi:hypothetical protein